MVLSLEKQILYLFSCASGCLEVKEMIQIYNERNILPQTVRNAVSKLKKEGYINKDKRSQYFITDKGVEFIRFINRKPLYYASKWDHNWYFVMLEVPETERKSRDGFRNDLLQWGFGHLYKGTYVSPWNFTEEVLRLGDVHQVTSYMRLLKGDFIFNEISPQSIRKLWALEDLEELYLEKKKWFQDVFRPIFCENIKRNNNPLTAFVGFLQLGEVLSEINLRDPMLPEELLPADWEGKDILTELQVFLQYIAEQIPAGSSYYPFVQEFKQSL
jgi:phenylacetic acid degradation operon negative regulatory protein